MTLELPEDILFVATDSISREMRCNTVGDHESATTCITHNVDLVEGRCAWALEMARISVGPVYFTIVAQTYDHAANEVAERGNDGEQSDLTLIEEIAIRAKKDADLWTNLRLWNATTTP